MSGGLWWWALPSFLLASGPPVVRVAGRDALASLRGELDFWVVFQVAVYGLAGAVAAWQLVRRFGVSLSRRQALPAALALLLLVACAVSAVWSPSAIATLAITALLGIAMLVVTQFAVCGTRINGDPLVLLHGLRLLAGGLILLVWVSFSIYFGDPGRWLFAGFRNRGGTIGVLATLGPVLVLISGYFLVFGFGRRWVQLAWIVLGIGAVWQSQTRAAYVTVILAVGGVWLFWVVESLKRRRRAVLGILFSGALIAALPLALMAQGGFVQGLWYRGDHPATMTTLSHRTTIWSWIFERVGEQPFGLGYSTGFRYLFTTMDPAARYAYQRKGLMISQIGEAHNSHLEFLLGAGWPGFLFYAGLITIVVVRALRILRFTAVGTRAAHAGRIVALLLLMFLVEGLTNSAYALPTRQPFGFLLFVMGMIFMLEARVFAAFRETRRASWPPLDRSQTPVAGGAPRADGIRSAGATP